MTRSIAWILIAVMTVGPERVYALHLEAQAHAACAKAVTGGALGQTSAFDYSWDYDYDYNGNLTKSTKTDQNTSTVLETNDYTYDGDNRLFSHTKDGTLQVEYYYDADGIRVDADKAGGPWTNYLTDKNRSYAQVISEYEVVAADPPNSPEYRLIANYTYGDDLIAQDRVIDPVADPTATARSYYHYDGQLSTRFLTNEQPAPDTPSSAAPTVTDTYTYDAFGNLLETTPGDNTATTNNYLYTGEQYDPNVNFYYLRARYYDQAVGRFVNRDLFDGSSADPANLHKYLYANVNPTNKSDPSGLSPDYTLSGLLANICARIILFMLRHPLITAAIGFAFNLLLPVEVHEAMIASGVPGFTGLGEIGLARARAFKLLTNRRLTGWLQRRVPRLAGEVWETRGRAFEEFLEEMLFPGARTQPRTTGNYSADFEWRGRVIEAKTGLAWGGNQIRQLAAHAAYAERESLNLVYVFLSKPAKRVMQDITKAGGTVFYLFD